MRGGAFVAWEEIPMSRYRWTIWIWLFLLCTAASQSLGQTVSFVDESELIDAQGNPAAFYLESTRAYVRVQDAAANSSSTVVNTTTVQMSADLSGDQQTLTLQETGVDTGIFEGSVQLRRGAAVSGNGKLETTASGSAPYRFDTVRATHSDSSDAVDTAGSLTSFIDAYGNEVSSFAAGARAYLQVEDHNFNDSARFDTVTATVQSSGPSDAEGLTLLETGRDTGVFRGSIPMSTSPSGSGSGTLTVQPGQTVLAQHVDANNVLASGAQATVQSFEISFIEKTGEPTLDLVEDGTAWVRVTGPAANTNGNVIDSVTIQLQTLYTQDEEDLTLTETGPNTGIFEGSIHLNYAPSGIQHNAILDTGDSGSAYPVQLEQVTASFSGAVATARTIGSRVWFIDSFGRIATSFPIGGPVGIRVEKPSSNNPGQWDQINFQIDVRDGNLTQSFYLDLNETAPDSGIFEGTIPSSTTYSGYYVIHGAPGLTMTAISPRAYGGAVSTATAVFTGGQVFFIDDKGQAAGVYMDGTWTYVRVIDHQRSGTVAVTIRSAITGDQESFTLAETNTGTGVFESRIQIARGAAAPGDFVLQTGEETAPIHVFDTLTVSYTDASGGTTTATASTLGYRIWFIDAYGNVVNAYPKDTPVYVRIERHNGTNPDAIDPLIVQVLSETGDDELIQAFETGKDTGIFEGSVQLTSGTASVRDGWLQAPPGTGITADRFGAAAPMPARARIETASVRFIDDAGRPTSEILQYGTARVRVVSPADNHSSTAIETVTAQVRSLYELDVETVTLTETGRDTGIFEGSIHVVYSQSNALPGNGELETRDSGDSPRPKPEEVTAVFGPYAATGFVIGSRIVFIDDLGNETSTFPVGANVGVRLIEPSSNTSATTFDTTTFQLKTSYNAGSGSTGTSYYYLDLSETGRNTGVFEGRIPSAPHSSSYNVIDASVGKLIEASRFNQYSPLEARAQAVFTGGQVAFVDAQGQPANVYLEGTRAYFRLEDHQATGSVSVQVTTDISHDFETVTLQQAAPGSSIFTGSIPLFLGNSGTPGNGTLETGESFGPPFQYETLRATYGNSTDEATTLGYRFWFVDASGAVASSYLQGTRAYVRLEDHNQNNPNLINTLYVELRSSSGDQEFLQVTETGLATGIYEGSIPLDRGSVAAGDGQLQAPALGEITADRQGAWVPAPAHAFIDAAAVEFIDEAGQKTSELLENGTASIRVTSGESNLDPAVTETVVVQVHSRYADDQENATLTETGPNTGVFEGSIQLDFQGFNGTVIPGNGTLETRFSPESEMEETTATFGATSVTARNVLAQLEFTNLRGQVVSSYPLRSAINIHVRYALDDASYLFSYPVTLQSSGGDTEYVMLSETGPGTGIFEGRIYSTEQDGYSYNNVLNASAGQVIEVRVSTPYGSPYTAQATMTSSMAPQAYSDNVEVEAGASATIDVLANDVSAGGPLSVVRFSQPEHGSVTFDAQGVATYTAAPDYSGSDSFAYLAADAQGGEAQGYVILTVTPANRPPVATDDTFEIDEDTVIDLEVLANDSDPDGNTLMLQSFTEPSHGFAYISGNAIRYFPAPDYHGTDSFTYVINDGHLTSTATVSINLRSVNDPPYATADTANPVEDTPTDLDVLANDFESDGDPLTVTSVTEPAHGTVVINPDNRTLRYTPTADYDGYDWFYYTMSDGNGGTSTAQVELWMVSANDAPVANADSAVVAEDGTVNMAVLANDTDVDYGNTLSVTAVTQGAHGAVAINPDKTVKYTPAANYNGPDSFTYTVSDDHGGSATATVTVTVTSVNDAPVAVANSATVAEDGTVDVNVLGNNTDADGDTLTITAVTQGAQGAVAINPDKTVKYTPAANYSGPDSFTYTVSDGNGGSATGTVTITVTSVNDAPVAVADSATVLEDDTININVLGNDSDPDDDTLSVTTFVPASHGTVGINADKTVKYTPTPNYNGPDSLSYTVSDGKGGTATATVTITVTSVSDAPIAKPDSATISEDGSINLNVLFNDIDYDGDTLSVASVTQGAHGTVTILPDKTVKYKPAVNYNGPDSFTYVVSDVTGETATGNVTVTITPSNDPPTVGADSATVAEDGTIDVNVLGNDSDPDGDTLSVASVTQGAHGTVVINPDKTVKYTPAANYNGPDSFTYIVSDGIGGNAPATVTVTVTPVNDAPVANPNSATVAEDGVVNVSVLGNDSDPDGDTLSVASVTQGAHGTVAINPDKTVKYTPAANYNGPDAFTYTISDGNGGTSSAAVSITVTAVNDAPVAANDSATVVAGSSVTVSVLANDADIDGPGLSVTSVTQGVRGSVVINANGTVTYTAGLYVGTDSFTYAVSDGAGGTATATVNVTLTAPARVVNGLQARYNFNEGSGSAVSDSANVGLPLNLTIASTSSVTWVSGGLKVNTATAISSASNATKIISAAQASNEITIETWVTPTSLTLTGPARIATIAKNSNTRNLIFGQSGSRYETQLKTSTGTSALQSPASSLTQALAHVVYTRSSTGQATYYINGVQVSTVNTTGNFSTWGTDQKLTLSDNWQGTYFLMAVYGRSLTAGEVQQNYLAGVNAN
jgi:hypothetical protein